MKSYDVIGYIYEGEAYCGECFTEMSALEYDPKDTEELSPIFADYEGEMTCNECQEEIR